MRKFKKEQYYVNSLHTKLPESDQKLDSNVELKTFKQLKKEIYQERLIYFKGNAVLAAKSLEVQRNCFIATLDKNFVERVRKDFKNKSKTLFLEVFKQYNGNSRIIANRLKISISGVSNLAVKYGLKTRTKRVRKQQKPTFKQLELFK